MLMLRGSTYYYHRNISRWVRPLLGGKKQIWKSLRTSGLDVAKLRSLEEGQRVERQFQDLKRRASSSQTNPDSLARLYSSTALADGATWRRTRVVLDDERLNVIEQPIHEAHVLPSGSAVGPTTTLVSGRSSSWQTRCWCDGIRCGSEIYSWIVRHRAS
jgi:hypothetical protein